MSYSFGVGHLCSGVNIGPADPAVRGGANRRGAPEGRPGFFCGESEGFFGAQRALWKEAWMVVTSPGCFEGAPEGWGRPEGVQEGWRYPERGGEGAPNAFMRPPK